MLPEIMEAADLLDDARVDGDKVAGWLAQKAWTRWRSTGCRAPRDTPTLSRRA